MSHVKSWVPGSGYLSKGNWERYSAAVANVSHTAKPMFATPRAQFENMVKFALLPLCMTEIKLNAFI